MKKITVYYPFSQDLNKNCKFIGRSNKVRRTSYKDAINELAMVTRSICNEYRVLFDVKKTRMDVMVVKPNNRCDCYNFLDGIADAVKLGIGVDDRWFCGSVDWTINKEHPKFIITISQE